jgi:4-hydroxythreonine-4-phosphate dehydrogenase
MIKGSKMSKPVVLITMGDPAGAGPEITLKALSHPEIQEIARFIIVGDLKVLMKAKEIVKTPLNFVSIDDLDEFAGQSQQIGVIDLKNVEIDRLEYGKPSQMGGKASYEYIVTAVNLIMKGKAHALVTAPISKESLHLAGYNYPGHTELLADLAGVKTVKMMLIAKHLRVSHVTTHVSLRKAITELIKTENIYTTIKLTHEALVRLFGIERPKIAVAGLNPHASESGLFGDEEEKEIAPAIRLAEKDGIDARGPYPPDSVFYRAYYQKEFDAVIAMYHDQGHIPVKMVGFMEGVNMTLGLPFIRTSPDHGTVWGKAGKGTADETAMLEAIKLAAHLAKKLAG